MLVRGTWTDPTQVENVNTGEIFEDSSDVLISATGALNDWKWPSIPGLQEFKGALLHSANWDESFDWTVKLFRV